MIDTSTMGFTGLKSNTDLVKYIVGKPFIHVQSCDLNMLKEFRAKTAYL